jgi:hypothetical protein
LILLLAEEVLTLPLAVVVLKLAVVEIRLVEGVRQIELSQMPTNLSKTVILLQMRGQKR